MYTFIKDLEASILQQFNMNSKQGIMGVIDNIRLKVIHNYLVTRAKRKHNIDYKIRKLCKKKTSTSR